MVERTTPKIPIELAWDEYVASMEGRLHGQTDAFKFAWKAAKKEWVDLTQQELDELDEQSPSLHDFVQNLMSKLKEKNT